MHTSTKPWGFQLGIRLTSIGATACWPVWILFMHILSLPIANALSKGQFIQLFIEFHFEIDKMLQVKGQQPNIRYVCMENYDSEYTSFTSMEIDIPTHREPCTRPYVCYGYKKNNAGAFVNALFERDWAPIVTCTLFWDILGTYECVDTVPCVVVIAACIVSWLHPTSSRGSWPAAIKLSCLPFVAMNWISLKGAYFPRPDGIRKICKSVECICMCLCIWKNNNILFSWNKNVKTKTQ